MAWRRRADQERTEPGPSLRWLTGGTLRVRGLPGLGEEIPLEALAHLTTAHRSAAEVHLLALLNDATHGTGFTYTEDALGLEAALESGDWDRPIPVVRHEDVTPERVPLRGGAVIPLRPNESEG